MLSDINFDKNLDKLNNFNSDTGHDGSMWGLDVWNYEVFLLASSIQRIP